MLERAAELISRHIPRHERGAIFERIYPTAKQAEITRGLLRIAERRERIDRWRTETRARHEHNRVEFVPLEDVELAATSPVIETYPRDFLSLVVSTCTASEQALVWALFIGDGKQVEMARSLGLSESRISHWLPKIRVKLWRRINELWPRLREEWR